MELKQNYQQSMEGKKLKWLDYSSHNADCRVTGPCYIEAEHNVCDNFAAYRLFSTIRVLTCSGGFSNLNFDKIQNVDCNYNIDTLRLIDFTAYSNNDICLNDKLIQQLNLHRSLANLTIDIDMTNSRYNEKGRADDVASCIKCIETILCKQHYHNLKNVNILIKMYSNDIECVFNLLKRNVSILKHQLNNQLNIGLQIEYDFIIEHCTFEWCPQIDGNFLNKQKEEMKGEKIKHKQWLDKCTQ